MPLFSIENCQSLPPRDGLDNLLRQYYALLSLRMEEMGFPLGPAAADDALKEFWAHPDAYLPPHGCLVLARDHEGGLIGCGMLKRLDSTTGELKRVFVTEKARGTGAGRALIEAREQAARDMGLSRIVADTLTPNVEMRSLYPKLGFVEVFEPIETTTHRAEPSLHPHMHYFVKDL